MKQSLPPRENALEMKPVTKMPPSTVTATSVASWIGFVVLYMAELDHTLMMGV